jgi:hypothetical protein
MLADIELQMSTLRYGMIINSESRHNRIFSYVNSDEYKMIKNINLGITERLEIPIS